MSSRAPGVCNHGCQAAESAIGNTDPWLMATGQPHQTRDRQTAATGGHVLAEWSAIASPHGTKLQPPCLGARDDLNGLRRCLQADNSD